MRILYKFATRSRPDKFLNCLENIQSLALHDDYLILVTADYNDPSMFNPEMTSKVAKYKAEILYGSSENKVNAINRDLPLYQDWDIIINMSDDMLFTVRGFDKIIIQDFERYGLDNLLHYPDNLAGQALITMSIMGKPYYDRFGYIYNPIYKSLFCDNEQQDVAIKLGKYKYLKRRLFDHIHPSVGLASKDALYVHTESFWDEDKATFERRKLENFE